MWDRAVTLIDMDCFYCQVEARLDPTLKGKPMAVVQYNTWKGGGIIAVNYEARNLGVTRRMRGDDAQKQCPDIKLVSVPEVRGKADLTKYRDAGREVIAILSEFSSSVEKASIDEAYIDLTDLVGKTSKKVIPADLKSTFVVGYNSDEEGTKQWLDDVYESGLNDEYLLKLACAATLVEKIRSTIFERTGFHCSAGVSHNKILSKLSCGLHKPNRQTVLPYSNIAVLYEVLPLKKIRNLGGKFGDSVQNQLNCSTMGDVSKFSLKELQTKFGDKSGSWLYNIAKGIDLEPVQSRTISKSIGCCKRFPGLNALSTKQDVKHWLTELASEIVDRIMDDLVINKRKATLLTTSAHQDENYKTNPVSRSTMLNSYKLEEIINTSFLLLSKSNRSSVDSNSWYPSLKFLGISVGKFVDVKDSSNSLLNFFKLKRDDENCDVNVEKESATVSGSTNESKNNNVTFTNVNNFEDTNMPSTSSASANKLKDDSSIDIKNVSENNQVRTIDYSKSFFCKYFRSSKFINSFKKTNYFRDIKATHINSLVKVEVHASDTSNDSIGNHVRENITANSSADDNVYLCNGNIVVNKESTSNLGEQNNEINGTNLNSINAISYDSVSEQSNSRTSNDDNITNPDDMVEFCPTCKQMIKLIDFLEHLDYHAACELHEQINENVTTETNTNFKSTAKSNVSTLKNAEKRKYKKSKNQNDSDKKVRLITSFFSIKP